MTRQHSDEERKTMDLMALAENFGKPFSEGLLEIWLELLTPYPAGQVNRAAKTVIEQYEFKTLPPFAVIKQALDDIGGTSERTLEIQALAEWGLLLEAVSRIGSYGAPQLHATTAYVVRLMGGWGKVCSWPESVHDFRRKEFIEQWVMAHGRTEQMRLGAGAVQGVLGQERKPAAVAVGSGLGGVIQALAEGPRQ